MCLSLSCFCCLSSLRPKFIELIALIANIIIIGLFAWSLIGIPWNMVRKSGKILLFVSFAFSILCLLVLLFLIFLRCRGTINGEKNGCAICFIIVLIIFDIIGFIVLVIGEALILHDMRDGDDYRGWHTDNKIKSGEWIAAAASPSLIEILWLIHFYCALCLHTLIDLRTSLSSADYLNESFDSKNNKEVSKSSLPFTGYDQNGAPIYSGAQANINVNPFNRDSGSSNTNHDKSGSNVNNDNNVKNVNDVNDINTVKVNNDRNNQDLNTNYAIV